MKKRRDKWRKPKIPKPKIPKRSPARVPQGGRLLALIAVLGGLLLSAGAWFYWNSENGDNASTPTTGPKPADRGILTVTYPPDGAVFPPDIAPPTFEWVDTAAASESWTLRFDLAEKSDPLVFHSDQRAWTPSPDDWEAIRQGSTVSDDQADGRISRLQITGHRGGASATPASIGGIAFRTSTDAVGAPLFYREVNLPFAEAVQDPGAHIRWRFGAIGSPEQPPIVLEKSPVCGNCHSFSRDGSLLGMDVDYGSDKGSYAICPIEEEISFTDESIITWSDYKREDRRPTFGLLSQVSPDGRYVISTVKDQSVFVALEDLAYSQLFFPIQGILCYYDCQTKEFHALPGADDPRFVQSNPSWSPDGRYIVFARCEAYTPEKEQTHPLGLDKIGDVEEFVSGRKEFKFDLYRVPFNEGKGGVAEPLPGASDNGKSNYFAKYSPDGKWIVFCRAENFMLLQPDSRLYIIPAEGGEARRLECNTDNMNSWHTWSPNSRWLVFSSKANSPYTQLFLTHIDRRGRASPPLVLSHLTASNMAANIPEFVNTTPEALRRIRSDYIDDGLYVKAGHWNALDGQWELAAKAFRKAAELNPQNAEALAALANALEMQGRPDEAAAHYEAAIAVDPQYVKAISLLGTLRARQGEADQAVALFRRAIDVDPESADAHASLGAQLLDLDQVPSGRRHVEEAIRLDPDKALPHFLLGQLLARQGSEKEAVRCLRRALEKKPDYVRALAHLASIEATSADPDVRNPEEALALAERACTLTNYQDTTAMIALADALAAGQQYVEAAEVLENAVEVCRRSGQTQLIDAIRSHQAEYVRQAAARR